MQESDRKPIIEEPNHCSREQWLKAAVLAILTLLVYLPAINSGFIWDDDRFLWQNPLIHASDGLLKFWFSTEAPDYFPLTSSMLWIEWRLFGENASGYHLVNVLLHIGSSLLLWRIFERLKIPASWVAALIFALHPVNVESVAWITERKNTLSMIFFCASIWAWLKFEKKRQWSWYCVALAAFLLALLSKTSVVMLPVVLLLTIWWKKGRIGQSDFILTIPFFALSAILSLVTIWFQYQVNIQHEVVRDDSIIARTAGAAWAVWFYLYKALIPINLSFVYPRWEINAGSPMAWVPAFALVALFATAFWKRQEWGRPVLFGFGCFVVTLLPVLGFLDIYFMRYSLVADHWQYVSLPSILALLVGCIAWYLRRHGVPAAVKLGAVSVTILVLFMLSWNAQSAYKNEEALWVETLKKNQEAFIAWNNLGVIREKEGKPSEAEEYYRRAIEIYPEYREAYFNLGHVLTEKGALPEAIKAYQRAVELDPKYALAWNNLGNALHKTGRTDKAIDALENSIASDSTNPDAFSNLGSALASLGQFDKARTHYREALAIDPDHPGANSNYASMLASLEEYEGAIEHFRRATNSEPDNPALWYNLASAEHLMGRTEEALEHYHMAIELDSALESAVLYATEIFLETNRSSEAVELLKEAARVNPNSLQIVNLLAWVLATDRSPAIRNGGDAVYWAEKANKLSGSNNPAVLDTLAVAQATNDNFEEATRTANEALRIAEEAGDKVLNVEIAERLKLFKQGKIYIEN